MAYLNLGILAHVDAGKTSLTERLLFHAGVVQHLGSVDSGTTTTDTLALERRRGITIRSAVATFDVGDRTVNLIDTPGHPEFIAEVERALGVLDAAVLVVSAVEGVEAQTRILLRTLQRMQLPTLIFVNKTDRGGADPDRAIRDIPDAIPVWTDYAEAIADRDEQALDAFVDDRPTPPDALQRLTMAARVMPAYKGSAITGEGISDLLEAVARLLPPAAGDPHALLDATVFKVESDRSSLVRVHSGTLRVRDRIGDEHITTINDGRNVSIEAGNIGRIRGLRTLRAGDRLGKSMRAAAVFPPPMQETTVRPRDTRLRANLHRALQLLAERDPLIEPRLDPGSGELTISLHGDIQKEVIEYMLSDEFGIDVDFGETVAVLRERPERVGLARLAIGMPENPYLAGLELQVEPGDGENISVQLTAPIEHVPTYIYRSATAFRDALEKYTREALARGGLEGWDVDDIRVTVTDCEYNGDTTPPDFRRLMPVVLRKALEDAGTVLCEPQMRIELSCPIDTLAPVMSVAARCQLSIDTTEFDGAAVLVTGIISVARLRELERELASRTRGEGSIHARPAGWRPAGS